MYFQQSLQQSPSELYFLMVNAFENQQKIRFSFLREICSNSVIKIESESSLKKEPIFLLHPQPQLNKKLSSATDDQIYHSAVSEHLLNTGIQLKFRDTKTHAACLGLLQLLSTWSQTAIANHNISVSAQVVGFYYLSVLFKILSRSLKLTL